MPQYRIFVFNVLYEKLQKFVLDNVCNIVVIVGQNLYTKDTINHILKIRLKIPSYAAAEEKCSCSNMLY